MPGHAIAKKIHNRLCKPLKLRVTIKEIGPISSRHYGLLASRQRKPRLALSRELLDALLVFALLPATKKVEPTERPHCARCGGERFTRRVLARPSVPQAEANSHDRRNNTS